MGTVRGGGRLLDRGPLLVLVAFSAVAVTGFGVFGRDPSRLAGLPPRLAEFYGVSFEFFAQGQVLLAGAVLGLELWRRVGSRWLASFAALYVVSLGSELMGTAFGVPFGPYSYTSLLGPRWLGLVPVLIPLSWFFMAVPSYGLASRAFRGGTGAERLGRIGLASLLLLSWDLTLDPAMSEATRYWVWGEAGPYYGMPLQNLFGWYVTGVVLMAILEWQGAREWLRAVSPWWLAAFFGANLLLSLGMAAVSGMWGAVALTAAVLGVVGAWGYRRSQRAEPGAAGSPVRVAARADR